MDPALFISGVSATMQAIQTWIKYRDYERASDVFDQQYSSGQTDPRIQAQSQILKSIVPKPVLDELTKRAKQCWDRYLEILKNPQKYLPQEIDDATLAVKACVSRELKRISDLNDGALPEGVLDDWRQEHSEERPMEA
jgi:hypothetical protein